jgi:hypothetical protein
MDANVSAGTDEAAVREVLSRLNNAWMHERGDALTASLNGCFADNVVMRGPTFLLLGQGRDFAVQSYRDFVAQAEVKAFSVAPADIDILGNTAVAQYKWTMTYVFSGQEHTEHGHDLFMLSRRGDEWLIMWRAMLPASA